MSCASYQNRCVILHIMLCVLLFSSCNPSIVTNAATAIPLATAPKPSSEQNRIQARISLARPGRVAFGAGSIWVSDSVEPHILRLDALTGKAMSSPIPLGFVPREIAYGEGAIWVVSLDRSRLARIDPRTNEVVAEVDLRPLQIPDHVHLLLAAGEGAVWITDQTSVIQIDPMTNQIVGQPLPAGEEIIAVALGHGTLWTGSHDEGSSRV